MRIRAILLLLALTSVAQEPSNAEENLNPSPQVGEQGVSKHNKKPFKDEARNKIFIPRTKISEFNKIIQHIRHKVLPCLRSAGWDLCLELSGALDITSRRNSPLGGVTDKWDYEVEIKPRLIYEDNLCREYNPFKWESSITLGYGASVRGDEGWQVEQNDFTIRSYFFWPYDLKCATDNPNCKHWAFVTKITYNNQISASYDYSEDPPVEVAAFNDPWRLFPRVGILWAPCVEFNFFFGPGFYYVHSDLYNRLADDTHTPIVEKVRQDFEGVLRAEVDLPLVIKNLEKSADVTFTADLRMYVPFFRYSPTEPDGWKFEFDPDNFVLIFEPGLVMNILNKLFTIEVKYILKRDRWESEEWQHDFTTRLRLNITLNPKPPLKYSCAN